MEQEELPAYLPLTLAHGIGNITARKLRAAYGLPQTIFEQSISALRQVVSKKGKQMICVRCRLNLMHCSSIPEIGCLRRLATTYNTRSWCWVTAITRRRC